MTEPTTTEPQYHPESGIDEQELRRLLQFLTDRPTKHQQGVWFDLGPVQTWGQLLDAVEWKCGTAGCLAGWTALQHGWLPAPELGYDYDSQTYQPARSSELSVAEVVRPDDPTEAEQVDDVAARILGLDEYRATQIFDGYNSLRTMWLLAHDWTDGRIQMPPEQLFDRDGAAIPAQVYQGHRA